MKIFIFLVFLFTLDISTVFPQESNYIFFNGGLPEGEVIYEWYWGFAEDPMIVEDIGYVDGTSALEVNWGARLAENSSGWITYGAFLGITGDVGFDMGDPFPDSLYFKLRAPDGVSESDTLSVWLYDPRYDDWNYAAYYQVENLQILNDDEWHQFSISLFDFEPYLNELDESNVVAVSFERPWHDDDETTMILYIDQVWVGLPPFVSVEEDNPMVVSSYYLGNNYPNPFNASTTIEYAISESGNVKIFVYDLLGQNVATLVNQNQSPGTYTVHFDASLLTSGIYYYHMVSENFSQINKMLLIK